jgi:hypothetical protein
VGIVAESTQMVTFLLSIVKVLWDLFVIGIGCLSAYLLILFLSDLLWDFAKDIIERIKKNK